MVMVTDSISARAKDLLDKALIIDLIGANAPVHPSGGIVGFDSWISKYQKAGVTWLSMSAGHDGRTSAGEMVSFLGTDLRVIAERSDEFLFVNSLDDVRRAKREGKLALNFNFQGSNPLQGNVELVEIYRRLGVGHMLLVYNRQNQAGGGCHDDDNPGLTDFGRAVVGEMNRVGMVVDASHTAYQTTMDIMELSTEPVIFSHSIADAVHSHERNIKDDQIRACVESGGVIGINGVAKFMSDDIYDVSAQTMFRHLDYIAELVGHKHVGLGLDHVPDVVAENGRAISARMGKRFGTDQYPPAERLAIAAPSVIAPLVQEMIDHGYTDEQVLDILGENWMRVFGAVWH